MYSLEFLRQFKTIENFSDTFAHLGYEGYHYFYHFRPDDHLRSLLTARPGFIGKGGICPAFDTKENLFSAFEAMFEKHIILV